LTENTKISALTGEFCTGFPLRKASTQLVTLTTAVNFKTKIFTNFTYQRQDMAEFLHHRREGREVGLKAQLVKAAMGADMVLSQLLLGL